MGQTVNVGVGWEQRGQTAVGRKQSGREKTPHGGMVDGGNRSQGRDQSGTRGRERKTPGFPVPVPLPSRPHFPVPTCTAHNPDVFALYHFRSDFLGLSTFIRRLLSTSRIAAVGTLVPIIFLTVQHDE